MPEGKILVVDDEEVLNELICDTMQSWGYLTVSAFSGSEALKLAADEKPDLILLDMTLPFGRGEVVYTQLRQMYATKDTPIFIITAGSRQNMAEFCAQKGITEDEFFSKPLDFARLKAMMAKSLSSNDDEEFF